jgi:uncharacterized protein
MTSLFERVRRRALTECNNRLHRSAVGFVHIPPAAVAAGDWVESPINPPDVIEGAPIARHYPFANSGDGGTSTGLWHCSAGRFKWLFQCDEVIRILDGEVLLNIDGVEHHLQRDSVAFFGVGTLTEWTVPNFVLKQYFHRHPSPILGRLLG